MKKNVGLIVNPIAGIGGSVGLKGSDGIEIQNMAWKLGAEKRSGQRAAVMLEQITDCVDDIKIICAPGEMGEDLLKGFSFETESIGVTGEVLSASDTERIAGQMLERGIDILLFAGGDGTARNVFNVVGENVPVIGIPAGVKIHSGVFATTPQAAAKVLKAFVQSSQITCRLSEVIDLDEEAYRQGRIGDTLYGYMNVPAVGPGMQNPKAASHNGDDDLMGICAEIRSRMEACPKDTVFIMGAGSTVYGLKKELSVDGTLLGIDAVKNGRLIVKDGTADQLKALAEIEDCRLIITAIGGQGHIFGRGNQQLKPEIIRAIGSDNIWIVAAASKIYSLPQQTLIVDTGDALLDEELQGYRRVTVGWQETLVCRVM